MSGARTSGLGETTVADAMHHGVFSCPPDTALSEVAEIMVERGVHAIVVTDGRPHPAAHAGIVSDLDLIAAATTRTLEEQKAAGSAASAAITVTPELSLARAAELMTKHATAHLLVVDGVSTEPIGVLSTVDIITVLVRKRWSPALCGS